MQELISQVEDLAGIEMNHTTSLVVIFGIIFLTAVVVHIILHWIVLRAFEKRASASSRCGCKLSPRINYFIVWLLRCKHHCQYSGRALAAKRQ
ncbi:Uncharacterized protein ybdG [Salmonella enterica subsp. arizonae]|uniref:Uncharacterized protein ybdG n=1 Tax=Salmonella enterica subsp. arizonae TaxID=59203 RepID=A0A2X4TH77_SALER|nr:Uncharacterized protein ybdG [Salmonella enterica subsp. arizonae]